MPKVKLGYEVEPRQGCITGRYLVSPDNIWVCTAVSNHNCKRVRCLMVFENHLTYYVLLGRERGRKVLFVWMIEKWYRLSADYLPRIQGYVDKYNKLRR